jgi:hypothetical protein
MSEMFESIHLEFQKYLYLNTIMLYNFVVNVLLNYLLLCSPSMDSVDLCAPHLGQGQL